MQTERAGGATGVRYGVMALTVSMSVLLYLDRNCISVAGDSIRKDLGLTLTEQGAVYSAFFFAYALAQVPAGWLGDRLGARRMLTFCVLSWSILTGLTAVCYGLATLLVVRALCGVAQAGAYPIAARSNSLWTPFSQRAVGSSLIALGGRAGGSLAPWLTMLLIVTWRDWRPVFWAYTVPGVVWAVAFWIWYRDRPAEHPWCNAAEVTLISAPAPGASDPRGKASRIPWADACRSLSLWMQCGTQFATNVAWVFLVTWLPSYLKERYDVTEEDVGGMASLPLVAGMVGCFLGGAATDWLTRRLGLLWGRNLLGMSTKFLAAFWVVLALRAETAEVAVFAFAMTSFSVDLGLGATWAYFQDAGGPYVGTLLGWANMFGNLGAFVGPLLLIAVKSKFDWQVALATCAGFYIVAGLCWYWVDARVPIVRATKE